MVKKIKVEETISISTKFYSEYLRDNLLENFRHNKEPGCFNGMCKIKQYKVTIELIPETKEELLNRCILVYLSDEIQKNYYNKHTLFAWINSNLNIRSYDFEELVKIHVKRNKDASL